MKDLRVYFANWYIKKFLPNNHIDNLYTYLLSRYYNVIIDPINPDVLFYELPDGSNDKMDYNNCIKIFCTSEPNPYHPDDIKIYHPNDRQYKCLINADYILTSYKIDSIKNYYVPGFLFWFHHHVFVSKKVSLDYLLSHKNFTKDDIKNKKFTVFLRSNNQPIRREKIFTMLKKYKHVDTKQEIGHLVTPYYESLSKINLLENYKFSFAMQNHSTVELIEGQHYYPGFIDEKIMDSYIANTIPIYYGNDMITDYFNEKSFLNWHSFDSDEAFVDKIIELDQNDDIYLEYLNQPTFLSLDLLKLDEIAEYLKKIIN